MSNMPENFKTAAEAKILRCGFSIGYFDTSDIERWAERKIAASEEPSIELIELAILCNTHPIDVMKLLTTVGQGLPDSDSVSAQIGFLGMQFENGSLSTNDVVRGLFGLKDEPEISDAERSTLYWLDYAWDLTLTGHESIENVDSKLREFVQPYVSRITAMMNVMELSKPKAG
jgi:hypothetical protein